MSEKYQKLQFFHFHFRNVLQVNFVQTFSVDGNFQFFSEFLCFHDLRAWNELKISKTSILPLLLPKCSSSKLCANFSVLTEIFNFSVNFLCFHNLRAWNELKISKTSILPLSLPKRSSSELRANFSVLTEIFNFSVNFLSFHDLRVWNE